VDVGLGYCTGYFVQVVVYGYCDLTPTDALLCSVILCCYCGYKKCCLSGPIVGIVWCVLICALIVSAQPFRFLVSRCCGVCCGEVFHHVGETLAKGLDSGNDCSYLCIKVFCYGIGKVD